MVTRPTTSCSAVRVGYRCFAPRLMPQGPSGVTIPRGRGPGRLSADSREALRASPQASRPHGTGRTSSSRAVVPRTRLYRVRVGCPDQRVHRTTCWLASRRCNAERCFTPGPTGPRAIARENSVQVSRRTVKGFGGVLIRRSVCRQPQDAAVDKS
jgi:hypothetical protein